MSWSKTPSRQAKKEKGGGREGSLLLLGPAGALVRGSQKVIANKTGNLKEEI